MRNHFFQIIHGPFFQSFCQDGVVCISAGLAYNFHSLIHGKSFSGKKTDQFRDDHRWVGVVDLDHHMLIQFMEIIAFILTLFQDQLSAAAYHKILLVDTELPSIIIRVIRVKEQGKVLLNLLFVKVNTVLRYKAFINGIYIKKMKAVAAGLVTGNVNVI